MVSQLVWHLLTLAIRKLQAKHNLHNELRLSSHKVNTVSFSYSHMKKTKSIISLLELQMQQRSGQGADLADLHRQQQSTVSAKVPWAFWQP